MLIYATGFVHAFWSSALLPLLKLWFLCTQWVVELPFGRMSSRYTLVSGTPPLLLWLASMVRHLPELRYVVQLSASLT